LSTILKALKQVDQTAPPEDIQSWPPEIDTKETVKARVKKIGPSRKVYLTLVLVLIFVAAGWLVYNQKDLLLTKLFSDKTIEKDASSSPASSQNGPVYQAKIYPPASKQAVTSPKKDSPPDNGNQRAGSKPGSRQTVTDRPSRPLAKIPAQKNLEKNQDIKLSSKPGPPLKPAPSKSGIFPSQTANPKNPIRNRNRTSVTPPAQKAKSSLKPVSRSYRRLDDSKLKLQAIAWSNDVAQRIAVVNGHIVREGESVEGYSVTQIRPDDIIVNDGTESWRLEFGLK
jgi:hypothetical protein